jgi:DNA invertase Pin-like site-specific DNA recombinase
MAARPTLYVSQKADPAGKPHLMTIAIYARISTNEDRQHSQNQTAQLREYASRMKWRIIREYTEAESGASDARPVLQALMLAAARREFDVLLVSDLSRLTRRGPAATFELLAELKGYGVEFWSMNEPHFRTTDAAGRRCLAGDLFIAIAAFIAQQERETLRNRVKAGMERARKDGVNIGRPRNLIDRARVLELRAEGKSIREIAHVMQRSKAKVERTLKDAGI